MGDRVISRHALSPAEVQTVWGLVAGALASRGERAVEGGWGADGGFRTDDLEPLFMAVLAEYVAMRRRMREVGISARRGMEALHVRLDAEGGLDVAWTDGDAEPPWSQFFTPPRDRSGAP